MFLSILIPVRNDAENLRTCLRALARQDLASCEILVCDDGSQPPLQVEVPGIEPAIIRQEGRGPATARNRLAREACGEYLFFLDADCEPSPGTVGRIRGIVKEHPGIKAFFGSYDNDPGVPALLSTLKNLAHHHFHQESERRVSTFWCGCGVIRRDLFLEMGGLNEGFDRPSIEDVELGMRLAQRGTPVWVFPELQVKHHKHWTLGLWIYTDFLLRGVPWVRLMRSRQLWPSELNFSWGQRLGAFAALLLVFSLLALPFRPHWWPASVVLALCFVALNRRFLTLVVRRKGLLAGSMAVLFQLLYFWICIAALVFGMLRPAAVDEHEGERGSVHT